MEEWMRKVDACWFDKMERKMDASWFEKNVQEENLQRKRTKNINSKDPRFWLNEERMENNLKHH